MVTDVEVSDDNMTVIGILKSVAIHVKIYTTDMI